MHYERVKRLFFSHSGFVYRSGRMNTVVRVHIDCVYTICFLYGYVYMYEGSRALAATDPMRCTCCE